MQKIVATIVLVFSFLISFSQDFSNKGKEFWIAYSAHIDGTTSVMGIYLTATSNTTATVVVGPTTTLNVNITANQVTRVFLGNGAGNNATNAGVYLNMTDGIKVNAAIKITSPSPIVVYSHIIRSARSGATLVLPTPVLGTEYLIPNYKSVTSSGATGDGSPGGVGVFSVIATQPNTVIEINPSTNGATGTGKVAGVPYQVTLVNAGDCYQFQSASLGDISGTTVKSLASGGGGCKPIAVFGGSTWSTLDCSGASGGDNLYQQIFPTRSWGRSFVTAPFINKNTTVYRIFVLNTATQVSTTINGITTNLATSSLNAAGKFYQFSTAQPVLINADKPIMVTQYITSQTCNTGCTTGSANQSCFSDPEMVILNPIEQTLKDVTFFSAHSNFVPSGQTNISLHFVNVIIAKNFKNTVKIDGNNPIGTFIDIPNSNYSYLQENLTASSATNPVHRIIADSSFSAIVYGYGNVESYGYNGGTNVIDLYQYVTIRNNLASVNFPSTCINTPFNVSITLPYQPVSMVWDFGNSPNINPNTNITINPPVGQTVVPADSTFIKDSKTLYVYKLPAQYTYNVSGTYPIKVIVNNPTSDGCSGLQEIQYDVQVFAPPTANFTFTHNGCLTSPIQFNDASILNGRPLVRWDWNFGDATTDAVSNPTKTYSAPGTYNVNYKIVTDVGCIKDTTKTITISSAPLAKFGVTDTTCVNTPLTFTDSSTIASGTIIKWYWDFGNGRKDTLTTNASRTVSFTSTGPITVSLIVESNTGCKSIAFTKTLNISPFPVVDFNLPVNVCLPTGMANFANTSFNPGTGAVGLKYIWNFGDGNTSIATNPSHLYASTGPFTVSLTVDNIIGCRSVDSKSFSSIFPKPTATAVASRNLICLRDTVDVFDNTNVGASNVITKWFWNLGNGVFKDTTQNLRILFSTSGNKTVQLFVQTDKGCFSDTANILINVNPLPTGAFTINPIRCEKNAITFTDASVPNASRINEWNWFFSNGSSYNKTTNTPFTETFATWGNYTAKLVVKTLNGCVGDTAITNFLVNPLPQPGFILPEVCLADAAAIFIDTSKIADASSMTYQWNFGDPINSSGSNPNTANTKNTSHKYSAIGNYPVQLKVTSINSCIDSITQPITVNGSIPKANYAVLNSGNLCSNDSVRIQNTSSVDFGTITKVEIVWDTVSAPNVRFRDDFPAPNKVYSTLYPNFQSPASKTIYVKFISFSGGICRDSVTKAITLHQSPKVQFVTIPGICSDTTPRLISQATETGGVPGAFVFTGNGVASNGIYTPQGVAVGTYPIKYVYTSNVFGCKDSATKSITVWPSPQAKWGISSPQCEQNAITFTDTSIANFSNIVSWQWNFGDGNTQTRTNNSSFNYTYASAGNYTVSLRVITDSGCRSIVNQQPIKINYLPKVGFTLPSICLPDGRGTFNDTSTIGDGSQALFSYNWNFGDINNTTGSTLRNPTHQYSALGPYTVKLIVTSKDLCKDSATQILTTVYPQPKANFNAQPDTICIGDVINFTDLSLGITSPPDRWNWNLAQGTISGLRNPSKQFNDSGTFNISLHVFNAQNCVSDTVTYPVFVMPYPKLELGPDLFFLEGGTLKIKPQFIWGNNLTYLWSPGTGLDSIDIRTPSASPLVDTRYKLVLTGLGGCAVSDSLMVTVLKAPVIPNTFSPNNDGINDTWRIQHLESYPGALVQVYDRYGKQVFTSIGYGRDWDGKFLGTPLPIGTYYYIVDPKNGRKLISGSITILR